MNLTKIILCLFACMALNSVYAAGPVSVKTFTNNRNWNFIENRGQLAGPNGKPVPGIKYYGHQNETNIYCQPGMISFVFTKVLNNSLTASEATGKLHPFAGISYSRMGQNDIPRATVSINRTDLTLINSNPNAQITATNAQEYYENFYGANLPEDGINHVPACKTITYKEIYPHIDMVLHAVESGIKYEFMVYPGGKVIDIRMQWKGIGKMGMTAEGGIRYGLASAQMKESSPTSFQKTKIIASAFIINGSQTSFKIGRYDKTKPLLIDPELIWGSYFGGGGFDYGTGIATDGNGNVYVAGATTSASGIATTGAFQTLYKGTVPEPRVSFLAKYNSSGKVLWATYYGDSNVCHGVATDGAGNVYITGETVAKQGITTTGAQQTKYGGPKPDYYQLNGDAYLVKFNTFGNRQWGTYYGGNGNDCGYGIATDISGNIFITGGTNSASGIATNGAYQSIFNPDGPTWSAGGEAFLAKFNASGFIVWATYFGYDGSLIESDGTNGICVATDQSGNVYFAGETGSVSGIATKGAFKEFYTGTRYSVDDGFLAKFSSAGSLQWATYYGDSLTSVSAISLDFSGNVFVSGATHDKGLATAGVYQHSYSGYRSAFLAKFSGTGMLQWATYFGGSMDSYVLGVTTDSFSGLTYLFGVTNNRSGIATAGAYESAYKSSSGSYNNYLAAFNEFGARVWATYYGGIGNPQSGPYNFGGACSDNKGNVYITGSAANDSSHSTKGASQTSYGGGSSDAFLARFSVRVYDPGIDSFVAVPSSICKDSAVISIRLHNYGAKDLDTATIYLTINGTRWTAYSWTGKLLTDSGLTVNLGKVALHPGDNILKSWVVDSFRFNDSSSILIKAYKAPKALYTWLPDQYAIEKEPVSFIDRSRNAASYYWSFGNGDTSLSNDPVYLFPDSGAFTVMLIARGYSICPADTVFHIINVSSNRSKIYVPDVFSPNGDHINDVFDISGFAIKSYSFDIFNRWGVHIYNGSTFLQHPIVGEGPLRSGAGWDGTFKGEPVPEGVYIYQFDVIDIQGNHHKFTGSVTLAL